MDINVWSRRTQLDVTSDVILVSVKLIQKRSYLELRVVSSLKFPHLFDHYFHEVRISHSGRLHQNIRSLSVRWKRVIGFKMVVVRKYVDRNGSAAMQAAKRLASVTLEVNLRIPLHTGDEVRGPTLALKPRTDITRCPKQGTSGPTKSTDVLQIFFKK